MELSALATVMGLPDTSTEAELLTFAANAKKFADLETRYTALEKQIADQRTAEADRQIKLAVKEGRIAAGATESFTKLFAADFDSAATILAGMAKPVNLVQFAQQSAEVGSATADADADRYDSLDKAGKLEALKNSNRPEFDRLFTARYGAPPTHIA